MKSKGEVISALWHKGKPLGKECSLMIHHCAALSGLITSLQALCCGASVVLLGSPPQSSNQHHNCCKNNRNSSTLWRHPALKKDGQSRRDPHPLRSPGARFKAAVRTWFYAERLFNVLCMDQQLVRAWTHRAQTHGMLMLLSTSGKAWRVVIVGSGCGFSVDL